MYCSSEITSELNLNQSWIVGFLQLNCKSPSPLWNLGPATPQLSMYFEVRDRREDLELGGSRSESRGKWNETSLLIFFSKRLGPRWPWQRQAGNDRNDDVHSVDDTDDGHHLFDCLSDSLSGPRREVTCDDDDPEDGADVDPRDEADTEVHLLVASVSLRCESRLRKDWAGERGFRCRDVIERERERVWTQIGREGFIEREGNFHGEGNLTLSGAWKIRLRKTTTVFGEAERDNLSETVCSVFWMHVGSSWQLTCFRNMFWITTVLDALRRRFYNHWRGL